MKNLNKLLRPNLKKNRPPSPLKGELSFLNLSIPFRGRKGPAWVFVFFYMLLIFVLSSFPAPEAVHHVPIWYHIKLVHLIEYGFLCFLFLRTGMSVFLAILFTTLYGVTDEIHQMFVPNRTAQIIDVFTNFLGASIVCLIYQTFVPSKKKL